MIIISHPPPASFLGYRQFSHYLLCACSEDTVYNTVTSEEHRPSLQNHPVRQKTLPFVASVQHAKNTNLMVQCEECEMWCLVYSKYKLTKAELTELSTAINDYTYTCGASLSDLGLPG